MIRANGFAIARGVGWLSGALRNQTCLPHSAGCSIKRLPRLRCRHFASVTPCTSRCRSARLPHQDHRHSLRVDGADLGTWIGGEEGIEIDPLLAVLDLADAGPLSVHMPAKNAVSPSSPNANQMSPPASLLNSLELVKAPGTGFLPRAIGANAACQRPVLGARRRARLDDP